MSLAPLRSAKPTSIALYKQNTLEPEWTINISFTLSRCQFLHYYRSSLNSSIFCSPTLLVLVQRSDFPSGGSKGGTRDARSPGGPNSFNFMQFFGKFGKIVYWRPRGVGTPSSGKSWIRHCFLNDAEKLLRCYS